jgi:hypothetical protein
VELYWQGRTEGLGEKPVPVTLQIPYELAWVLTRASAMRGRRITACTSNFPHVCTFCILVSKSEFKGRCMLRVALVPATFEAIGLFKW